MWTHVHKERCIVPDKTLSFDKLSLLRAVRTVNKRLSELARMAGARIDRPRKIVAGEAEPETAAWTDGESYIAINLSYLRKVAGRKFAGVAELVDTILHEYSHDGTTEADLHGEEFYRRFHDIRFQDHLDPSKTVSWAIYAAAVKLQRLYEKEKKPSPVRSFFRETRRAVFSEMGANLIKRAKSQGGLGRFTTISVPDYKAEAVARIRAFAGEYIEFTKDYFGDACIVFRYDGGTESFYLKAERLPSFDDNGSLRRWAEVFLDEAEEVFGCGYDPSRIVRTYFSDDPMRALSKAVKEVAGERHEHRRSLRDALSERKDEI